MARAGAERLTADRGLSWTATTLKGLRKTKYLQFMMLGGLAWFIIFHYVPMYGVVVAFQDYNSRVGVFRSEWVGLENFIRFFSHPYFFRLIRNTFLLSFYDLLFAFPVPIVLALLLNEVRSGAVKRSVQTISFLPHFISLVALVSLATLFLSPSEGVFNRFLVNLGIEPIYFMNEPGWFRPLYILTGIWQNAGWGAIIFLGALSSIDPDLYESAAMDGANRFRRAVHITLPSLIPVITILFILRLGDILSAGFEQIFNLYNPLVYAVADVLDTYIYRVGLLQADYGLGAAVGLFKNIVALVLIFGTNAIVRRFSEYGIW
jgi:putative aldouronate transport system permease protein